MILLRGLVAGVFTIILSFLLSKYRELVILYIPNFTKKYIYEDLEEKYSSYLIVYYLMAWLIYLVLFLIIVNFFDLIGLNAGFDMMNTMVVRKEYWIFPALIFSLHLSNIIVKRLFKAILEESYEEFIIFMFCKQRCFTLKEMIIRIYFSSKIYRIYSKVILTVLSVYIFLGMLYYSNINNQGIVINNYFSILEKKYSYDDIGIIVEEYSWKEHKFTLVFKDGSIWNSSGILTSSKSEENYKLMKIIEDKSEVKAIELK